MGNEEKIERIERETRKKKESFVFRSGVKKGPRENKRYRDRDRSREGKRQRERDRETEKRQREREGNKREEVSTGKMGSIHSTSKWFQGKYK